MPSLVVCGGLEHGVEHYPLSAYHEADKSPHEKCSVGSCGRRWANGGGCCQPHASPAAAALMWLRSPSVAPLNNAADIMFAGLHDILTTGKSVRLRLGAEDLALVAGS